MINEEKLDENNEDDLIDIPLNSNSDSSEEENNKNYYLENVLI